MLTEGVIDVVLTVVAWVVGLMPDTPDAVAGFYDSAPAALAEMVEKVVLLGPVIPFGVLADCWNFLVIAVGFALAVEVIRVIASYVFLGGGAT